MTGDQRNHWEEWRTPATIIGAAGLLMVVISWQLNGISDRITSIETREGNIGTRIEAVDSSINNRANAIDARLDSANRRIDEILKGQNSAVTTAAQMQIELFYVRGRLDQIAERLEIAEAPAAIPTLLAGAVDERFMETLRESGLFVYNADELVGSADGLTQYGSFLADGFFMTGDDALIARLREAGIMPLLPSGAGEAQLQ